jgi:hypothetical protein
MVLDLTQSGGPAQFHVKLHVLHSRGSTRLLKVETPRFVPSSPDEVHGHMWDAR